MTTQTEDRHEVLIGKSRFSFDPTSRLHVVKIDGQSALVYVLKPDGALFCFSGRGPVDIPNVVRDKIVKMYFGTESDSS